MSQLRVFMHDEMLEEFMLDEMLEKIETTTYSHAVSTLEVLETFQRIITELYNDDANDVKEKGVSLLKMLNRKQLPSAIEMVLRCVKYLEDEGYIFSTIDKYHYQCVALLGPGAKSKNAENGEKKEEKMKEI